MGVVGLTHTHTNYFSFRLLIPLFFFSILFAVGCNSDETQAIEAPVNLDSRSRNSNGMPTYTNDWSNNSYLTFDSRDAFEEVYYYLQGEFNSLTNVPVDPDSCFFNPRIDEWEIEQNFVSMRRYYEIEDCRNLFDGLTPSDLHPMRVYNEVLASMISVDGLVRIGDTLFVHNGINTAKAPISKKNRLKEILEGDPLNDQDIDDGIELSPPSFDCLANFSIQVNKLSKTIHVTYTGTTPSADVKVVWDVDGMNNPPNNSTGFSHTYQNAGVYEVCATVTVYDLVTDTINWTTTTTVTVTDQTTGNTSTTTQSVKNTATIQNYKVVCVNQVCNTVDLYADCFAGFDYTIGIDNVINFTNNSSVSVGTIDSVKWIFGDGSTSNVYNPTHAYECDKDYEVSLIIFSSLCPGGQMVSKKVNIEASGILCCDRNPQHPWTEAKHPSDPNSQKIRWMYDMSVVSWLSWLLDEDFKAGIEYYKYRAGGAWGTVKWRKSRGNLDVNSNGAVFANDEDGCHCQEPRTIILDPQSANNEEKKIFKDNFGGGWSNPGHRMKDGYDVQLDFYVNGTLYNSVVCQSVTGFICE